MLFEIKSWLNGSILFSMEADSLKLVVEAAVKKGVSLNYALLNHASLNGASLDGASLDGALLNYASLDGASLNGASLNGASLNYASLADASLKGASLADASLNYASLNRASLDGAALDGASLKGASLNRASLTPIRDDVWAVLSSAPREVEGLLLAIQEGRVDGSTYEGDCACLVGTLANIRKCDVKEMGSLKPNANRPSEIFFMGIHRGDKPETNPRSKIAAEWVAEWLANMKAAFNATL